MSSVSSLSLAVLGFSLSGRLLLAVVVPLTKVVLKVS